MDILIVKSEYEIERGKPVPSKNYGLVQGNIYFELRLKYDKEYRFITEPRINFNGSEKVPDLAIYDS